MGRELLAALCGGAIVALLGTYGKDYIKKTVDSAVQKYKSSKSQA